MHFSFCFLALKWVLNWVTSCVLKFTFFLLLKHTVFWEWWWWLVKRNILIGMQEVKRVGIFCLKVLTQFSLLLGTRIGVPWLLSLCGTQYSWEIFRLKKLSYRSLFILTFSGSKRGFESYGHDILDSKTSRLLAMLKCIGSN